MSGGSPQQVSSLFSDSDADVTLQCKDGTIFKTHSLILRNTSGFFRTMFALPQPNNSNRDSTLLHVDEDQHIIEGLLRMVYGFEIPVLDSFESVESLLFAAEKYDMAGPISIIRSLILSPKFAHDPLRIYVLASHFHWDDVARTASTLTLKASLQALDTESKSLLCRLGSHDMLKLFELHWSRKEAFKKSLESTERFAGGNGGAFSCGHNNTDDTWPKLKLAMLNEMDKCPAGDTMTGPGFVGWPEWQALAAAKCSQCVRTNGGSATSVGPLYTHRATWSAIRDVIEQLPKSI